MRKSLEHVLFWKVKCLRLSSMVYFFSTFSQFTFFQNQKPSDKTQSARMNAVPVILMADIPLKKIFNSQFCQ